MTSLGQNLRKVRTSKNLSLKELSELSGVSIAMLSKIELGEKMPTIRIAKQIAAALSLSLSEFAGEHNHSQVSVIRNNERKIVSDPLSGVESQLLSPSFPSAGLDFIFAKIPPAHCTGIMPPQHHGVEEYIVVNQGKIKIVLNQTECYELNAGDSIHYQANVTREIVNLEQNQESHYYLIILSKNCS